MNTIMKNFKKQWLIPVTALVVLGSASCKKTLEVAPYSSLTDATSFSTVDRVEAAVNGVYDAAQSGFYAGGAVRGYPFGAATVAQGDMRGEDMLNQAAFYQITYESIYNNTTANNDYMFQTLYALINKANLTIDGVNGAAGKGVINASAAAVYVAECKFLRAMAHHELLLHFARPYRDGNGNQLGIIYRDFAINSASASAAAFAKTRTSVADGYTKVLADLDAAENGLPATTTGANKTYRLTKAAAIALKMRVRLHMGDWANVIVEGAKLVPAGAAPYVSPIGGWKLETSPLTPFTTAGWQGNETIFSIRNASTDNAGVNGALANMFGNTSFGGRALVRVSPIAYNLPAWRPDDLRRTGLLDSLGTGAAKNYLSKKYTDATTSTDPTPLIRYAEVLLTLAEAEARNAGAVVSSRAVDLLNAVRNRSVPVAAAYTVASFATSTALVKAILDERRIEFLAEGKRWGDIHRNATDATYTFGGIPAKIGSGVATGTMYVAGAGSAPYTTALAAYPYSDYRFIWPIPASETLVNSNYAQNPGY